MPASGRELDALTVIAERGGKTSTHYVAQKLGLGTEYTRTICEGLGRADYIDVTRAGICQITAKGWQELDRKGWRQSGPAASASVKCPHCGAANQAGTQFCASCMQYLESSPSRTYTIR
ncbi:MAG: zinc ribbon domain-containing protein [Dehalococcoidia bacterium]